MSSTLTKKLAQVKPGTLFLGVDLGLKQNVCVVLNDQARQLQRFSFATSRSGYEVFAERWERLQEKHPQADLLVGMEPTNFFWQLLAADLEQRQRPYRLVNPYTVKKHREGDNLDRSKDDQRDGFTIADLLRTGKFTQTQLQTGVYAQLRMYAPVYARLRTELARCKTLLWAAVGQVFPELTQVFGDFTGQTARAMLRRHACAYRVQQLSLPEFLQAVRQDLRCRKMSRKKLVLAHQLAAQSIGLREGLEALQHAIQVYLSLYETLETQFEALRHGLVEQFQRLPEAAVMLTIQGLGVVNAALILAELGNPQRYTSGRQWVKLAGSQPTPNSSGQQTASRTPMSKKGRARLRTWLFYACLRLVQTNPAFHRWYRRLCNREHHPLPPMQALGALMNKLLRILWALLKGQVAFDPDHA